MSRVDQFPARPAIANQAERSASLEMIDCLRGLAALGVALFHVRVTLWVGWREIAAHPDRYTAWDRGLAWLSAPLPFMGSLVMLFFVISGFCIHWPMATGRALDWREYVCRRFFRIYPPYLAVVALSWLTCVALSHSDPPRVGIASALMVQNYLGGATGGEGAGQLSTNWSLWSLPVEMELYLAYPLLLLGMRRFGANGVFMATALVSTAAAGLLLSGAGWLQINSARYLVVWFAGAWLAEKWKRGELRSPKRWMAVAAFGSLGWACYLETSERGGAWSALGFGGFYFWLMWALLFQPPRRVFFAPPIAAALRWLGARSYSLYLLHFPLFYVMGAWWVEQFGDKPHSFAVPVLAVLVILPAVALFFRGIEKPSHALARLSAAAATRRQGEGAHA